MNLQSKYSDLMLNLLVALAISLVVNFSYVLLLIVEQKGEGQPRPARASVVTRSEEGVLHVSPDGHGYIVYGNRDSVYVPMQRIRRMDLSDGDRLVVDVVAPRRYGAHPVMNELRMRNGEEFDYSTLYNRPSRTSELTLQLIYYLVVSFIMLSILTSARRNYKAGRFALHCMGCLVAAAALYILAPVREWHSGQIVLNFMSGHIFDYMLLLKCSFAVAVSMLYGWVYVLNSKQQAVVMENERLKNENLTTRYNMLVGQINPHFFMNTLNNIHALIDIDTEYAKNAVIELSKMMRYVLYESGHEIISLNRDIQFVQNYIGLMRIRYTDAVDIRVEYPHDLPPQVSIPPLLLIVFVENAFKHGVSYSKPSFIHMRIDYADGKVVSTIGNSLHSPQAEKHNAGIGLENVRKRLSLIYGPKNYSLDIEETKETYTVKLVIPTLNA